jgi:ABC-2 type transport system permease protein
MISLKFAMLANSSAGLRKVGWVAGALLVLGTWVAAVLSSSDDVRHDVLVLVFAAWAIGGAIGPVLMSGAGTLRAEYFALLPLSRSEVGRGLLASVLVSVPSAYVVLALLSGSVHAVSLAPATVLVVIVGAPLTWLLVVTLSRLVYGLLGAAMRSKLGIEIAGVQFGLLFAAMFTGWIIVQVAIESVPRLLQSGIPEPITAVLDAFPTSWMVLSIEAAARGDFAGAGLLLLALAAVDLLVIAATIPLLVPRSRGTVTRRQARRSAGFVAGRGVLPATQLGAVISKELRQWRRDPWRALETSTAVWTGATIGVFAMLGSFTSPAAPFAGLIVAFMVGLSGCNLYGQDGSAVWQNVVGEDETSVRSDVRGRQWAMLLVFVPRALIVSAVFVIFMQAWWALPILAAAFPAAFGAAVGAAILISAVGVSPGVDPRRRVGPNDATGNIAIHVWIAILVISIGVLPTAGAIVWAQLSGNGAIVALSVVIGIVNGVAIAWGVGSITIGYLSTRMVDVFSRIRYGQVFREAGSGVLASIEDITLKGEQKMHAEKQKERDKKLAARP